MGGGGTRLGYCRLAVPAAVLAALEVDEPIVWYSRMVVR